MGVWDRVGRWLGKAFRLGPAVVDRAEEGWGHAQEDRAPEEYGRYVETCVAVYRCSDLRAKNLAGLPVRLWRVPKKGGRDKQEVVSGRLWSLLRKPNRFWTWRRLLYMTELSLCAWGQCYWVLERGKTGKGVPREIWWARPDKMVPVPHETEYLSGFVYRDRGAEIPLSVGEVVWFRYPNPNDEYSGLSPLASLRLSVDTGQGAIRSNKTIFDQGLQMAGVISPEDKSDRWPVEEVERLQMLLSRRFKGVDKAHKVMVLSHAAKFSAVSLSPRDAQFSELMLWSKREAATAYGLAPELIGDHSFATYSNMEQAERSAWTDTLCPEADLLSDELTCQLLPLFGDEADVLQLDYSGVSVLQEDRAAVVQQAFLWWQMRVPLNRLLQEYQPSLLAEGVEGYPWGDEPGGAAPAAAPAAESGAAGAAGGG